VVELRKLLLLPLDDLLVITREFIHPDATRSGIHRTLARHDLSNLKVMLRERAEAEGQAKAFLQRLIDKAPFIISKVLTDTGKEFTDRFIANGKRKPTGDHVFDQVCQQHDIEHRLTKPRHPQTNGMVERFNGRVSEILKSTHFDSSQDLHKTL